LYAIQNQPRLFFRRVRGPVRFWIKADVTAQIKRVAVPHGITERKIGPRCALRTNPLARSQSCYGTARSQNCRKIKDHACSLKLNFQPEMLKVRCDIQFFVPRPQPAVLELKLFLKRAQV
jgi:hypothetical protein